MVNIITEGKIKYQSHCNRCGCVFEFEAEDVTRETVWDDHGGHYPVCDFYHIDCPYCGEKVNVEDVPKLLEETKKMKHVDR